jgi:hypothetical protein
MTNIVYLSENVKKADWFLRDFFCTRVGNEYHEDMMFVRDGNIFVWGLSISNCKIRLPKRIDYFIDDVNKDFLKNDEMTYRYENAMNNIMDRLTPWCKTIGKEDVENLIEKELRD